MKIVGAFYTACLLSLLSCTTNEPVQIKPEKEFMQKIEFELDSLNAQGLYGPANGLRSLSYEFCIPADGDKVQEIHEIDADIKVYSQSPGRIPCNASEYLCIGETHNKSYRKVLNSLTTLPYVKRIIQSDFE